MKIFLLHAILLLCAVAVPFLLQTFFLTLLHTSPRPLLLAAWGVPIFVLEVCVGLIFALFLPVKGGLRPVFGLCYFVGMTVLLAWYSIELACSRFGNCF